MSYSFSLRKKAELDIIRAFDWYMSKNTVVSQQLINDLDNEFTYLCKNPLACAIRYRSIRIKPLKKFPLAIHYIISVKPKKIIILVVLFSKQNPNKWLTLK